MYNAYETLISIMLVVIAGSISWTVVYTTHRLCDTADLVYIKDNKHILQSGKHTFKTYSCIRVTEAK